MRKRIDRTFRTRRERGPRGRRFEHWYVSNQVYFITARCRDRFPAFASDRAKAVFWDRFEHCTQNHSFVPWVVSLLDNHYHLLGYNRDADELKAMVQRFHGSVAKLVNDTLEERRPDFWCDHQGKEFFDGCLRDEKQARLAYRYTLMQATRHGLMRDYREYPHTRVYLDVNRAVRRAQEIGAFLEGVPYARYQGKRVDGP